MLRWVLDGIKQAGHAGLIESLDLPSQGTRGRRRLSGALDGCPTEQLDGTQQLVGCLFRERTSSFVGSQSSVR